MISASKIGERDHPRQLWKFNRRSFMEVMDKVLGFPITTNLIINGAKIEIPKNEKYETVFYLRAYIANTTIPGMLYNESGMVEENPMHFGEGQCIFVIGDGDYDLTLMNAPKDDPLCRTILSTWHNIHLTKR